MPVADPGGPRGARPPPLIWKFLKIYGDFLRKFGRGPPFRANKCSGPPLFGKSGSATAYLLYNCILVEKNLDSKTKHFFIKVTIDKDMKEIIKIIS